MTTQVDVKTEPGALANQKWAPLCADLRRYANAFGGEGADTLRTAALTIERFGVALEDSRDWMESAADRLEARDFHNARHFAEMLRRQANNNRAAMRNLKADAPKGE